MTEIKLMTEDGEMFIVDTQVAKCSGVIKRILKNNCKEGDAIPVVPLPNVNSAILRKILEWADYQKDVLLDVWDKSKWEAQFLEVDEQILLDLFMAARDLDIKDLVHATCKLMIRNMVHEYRIANICRSFNNQIDLSDEEEQME